jgi:t-SNARE complex subunit (syntaxin)
MGLLVTLTDYAGPKIVNQICGPESWNGTKEKQFEKVCDEIVSTMDNVHAAVNACRDARSKKPFIHFIVTVMTLISLAWIGNRISK